MAKKKKLSIKFFINTELKPTIINGKEHFPLYAKAIYNRKSTRFRVLSGNGISFVIDPEMPNIDQLIEVKNFEKENGLFDHEKLIEYEQNLMGDNYEITGISDRISKVYTKPLFEHLRGGDSFLNFMIETYGGPWKAMEKVYDPFRLYHLAKFDDANIKDTLPHSVINSFFAETLLWLFVEEDINKLRILYTYKWLISGEKSKFKAFLKSFDPKALQRNDDTRYSSFFEDFSIDEKNIDNVLNTIDLAISEKIKWFS